MEQLKNWQKATQELAEAFARKYYTYEEEGKKIFNADMWWAGNEIGDCLMINDDGYSLNRITQALELNATYEQLSDFSEYENECHYENKDRKINFKNFVKLGLTLDNIEQFFENASKK